jgi:two-component system CheB/CheR fusion protein
LRLIKKRFDLVVAATNETVWDYDVINDEVWWSENVFSTFGYNQQTVLENGTWWPENIHPEDREKVLKSFTAAIDNCDTFWAYEYRFRRANDSYAYVSDRAFVLQDSEGKVVRMIGSMMDITERVELEKRKDEFISIASHELKTPLTTIQAYTQLLQKKVHTLNTEQTAEYLTKIELQIKNLSRLVEDLLDVSKVAIGKLTYSHKKYNFYTLLKQAVEEFQLQTHHHKIEIEGKTTQEVFVDRYRIVQVIYNFLSNAVKYSPNADKVVVKVWEDDHQIFCQVQDFGIGIPEKYQKEIFHRFYRISDKTRESISGLGLGLYICEEIIEHHKGKIWVESQENKGSSFFFSLPIKKHMEEVNETLF